MKYRTKCEVLKIIPQSFKNKEGETISFTKIWFMPEDGDIFDINTTKEDVIKYCETRLRKVEEYNFSFNRLNNGTFKLSL